MMSVPTLQTSVKVSVPLSSCYNEQTESLRRLSVNNLEGDYPEVLAFFVVDTHLTIDKPCIYLDDLWPNLDDKLKLQAIENMIDGSVDVIIGLDQL